VDSRVTTASRLRIGFMELYSRRWSFVSNDKHDWIGINDRELFDDEAKRLGGSRF